jgi:hypothetical protein
MEVIAVKSPLVHRLRSMLVEGISYLGVLRNLAEERIIERVVIIAVQAQVGRSPIGFERKA